MGSIGTPGEGEAMHSSIREKTKGQTVDESDVLAEYLVLSQTCPSLLVWREDKAGAL